MCPSYSSANSSPRGTISSTYSVISCYFWRACQQYTQPSPGKASSDPRAWPPVHKSTDSRDRLFAMLCFFPGLWTISMSYWLSCSSHQASCPSWCLKFMSHVKLWWSVRTVNFLLNKKLRNNLVNSTTASISLRVVQYRRCSGVNVVLANPVVRSSPFCLWLWSVPIAVSEAFVCNTKFPLAIGMAYEGGLRKRRTICSKALCSNSLQWNGFFPVRAYMVLRCMSEKLGT